MEDTKVENKKLRVISGRIYEFFVDYHPQDHQIFIGIEPVFSAVAAQRVLKNLVREAVNLEPNGETEELWPDDEKKITGIGYDLRGLSYDQLRVNLEQTDYRMV